MSPREVTLSGLLIALLLCLRALWPTVGEGIEISEQYIYEMYIAPTMPSGEAGAGEGGAVAASPAEIDELGTRTLSGVALGAGDPGAGDPATSPEATIEADQGADRARRLLTGRVDVNRASLAELEALPGVGPTLAGRIVEGRPYRRMSDLDRVKGIGPKLLERLGPYVEF